MRFSYHNHTDFSDGAQSPQEMIAAAYAAGFSDFAITDHIFAPTGADWTMNPPRYGEYVSTLKALRSEWEGRVSVIAGVEADWYREKGLWITGYEDLAGQLDFTVGAVHFLDPGGEVYLIDAAPEEFERCLVQAFRGSAKAMLTYYFESYMEMVEALKPDIAAHPDLMNKNNAAFPCYDTRDDWYVTLMERTASCLLENSVRTEVNGGGNYRRGNGVWYPSNKFAGILRKSGVPLTVGLDAHSTAMVSAYYGDTIMQAKAAGYETMSRYEAGQWSEVPVDELL